MKLRRPYSGISALTLVLLLAAAVRPSLAGPAPIGKVIVFHAGSLTLPMARIEKEFEARYPAVDVLREAGGSTRMARMISELGRAADIFASADIAVIDKFLIPGKAEWNIRFATNQLVLCYTDRSRFAREVSAATWYRILTRRGVVWGYADPDLDPCGYRSLMVMQLAEKYYRRPGLYARLLASCPKENVRPKSVELVSLLKTGNMDYAWEYLSVAVQHRLKYVRLPDKINLSNQRYDHYYAQARVRVRGKRPGTWTTRTGKACTYGVTLLKGAANPEAALAFLEYLLSPAGGLKILKQMGQPPLLPCQVPTPRMRALLPLGLQKLVAVTPQNPKHHK